MLKRLRNIVLTWVVFPVVLSGLALLSVHFYYYWKALPYSKVSQSVVMLTNNHGGGTGFLTKGASGKKYIITNAHVCGKSVTMTANRTGEETRYTVPVIRRDTEKDLCALEEVPGKVLPVGDFPLRFAEVYVVGHPLLVPQRAIHGIFQGIEVSPVAFPKETKECAEGEEEFDYFGFIFCIKHMTLGATTAIIYPGNSGSPVTDSSGNLQGVINSGDNMNNGGFILLTDVKDFLSIL